MELSLDESARRVDRFRSEVNDHLDRDEIHLRNRVEEAEKTSSKARELLGVQHMTRRGRWFVADDFSICLWTLENNAASSQYLRTMVKALTDAVEHTPRKTDETPDLSKLPESTSPTTMERRATLMMNDRTQSWALRILRLSYCALSFQLRIGYVGARAWPAGNICIARLDVIGSN